MIPIGASRAGVFVGAQGCGGDEIEEDESMWNLSSLAAALCAGAWM